MSTREYLYDSDRTLTGAAHAIERARARGVESIEPDDLFVGQLLAVSRFGIVDLNAVAIDLEELGLRFDLPAPEVAVKPSYSPAAASAFDRAARVARVDGAKSMAPVHLLVALGDMAVPTFARIAERYALSSATWRRLLAATVPPESGAPGRAVRDPAPAVLNALLSPEEAAATLGVHIQTVRGYIRSGKLPAFRVAGERALRIQRSDLTALLEHLDTRPAHSVAPSDKV